MSALLLCKDCKHAVERFAVHVGPNPLECHRPGMVKIDLVTGRGNFPSCISQRFWIGQMPEPEDHCGESGEFWEAK